MRSLLAAFGIGLLALLSGCGMTDIDLRYTHTGQHSLVTFTGPKVMLRVHDAREKKVFFRTALGENDDAGKHGMLRLRRPLAEVVQDGFTDALQRAGCHVFPGSPCVLHVQIKRFITIDRKNNTNTIISDIALDVSVVYAGAVQATKSFSETDSHKSGSFKAWQQSVPKILNDSLNRAIDKAVWDPDILLAIEMANDQSTTREDIVARLNGIPPSLETTVTREPDQLSGQMQQWDETVSETTRQAYRSGMSLSITLDLEYEPPSPEPGLAFPNKDELARDIVAFLGKIFEACKFKVRPDGREASDVTVRITAAVVPLARNYDRGTYHTGAKARGVITIVRDGKEQTSAFASIKSPPLVVMLADPPARAGIGQFIGTFKNSDFLTRTYGMVYAIWGAEPLLFAMQYVDNAPLYPSNAPSYSSTDIVNSCAANVLLESEWEPRKGTRQ